MNVEQMLGIKLKWYQRLYINVLCRFQFNKQTSKTGLNYMLILEKLKRKAKTTEEKQMYETMQK